MFCTNTERFQLSDRSRDQVAVDVREFLKLPVSVSNYDQIDTRVNTKGDGPGILAPDDTMSMTLAYMTNYRPRLVVDW